MKNGSKRNWNRSVILSAILTACLLGVPALATDDVSIEGSASETVEAAYESGDHARAVAQILNELREARIQQLRAECFKKRQARAIEQGTSFPWTQENPPPACLRFTVRASSGQ